MNDPSLGLAGRDQCQLCTENHYCEGSGISGIETLQVSCPTGGLSPAGSAIPSDCYCGASYYGTGDVCNLCSVGFYCPGRVSAGLASAISCGSGATTSTNGTTQSIIILCHTIL
jgi:hypothetical protein